MAKVKIYVTHKKGILDPQGKTVETALKSLGYKNVSDVHIGKYIELEIEGRDVKQQVKEMCEKLLSNPIIEQYRFEVET
ncbi:MAG: phosphoribosylformylglycinamidine synthase subunit PurS [Candidatus Margulisiibacteriota bacterium]|nr:phosphoribosylformylglycinamidine synthase subunit PurS [Candidatus Saganbacteria bacterium]